MPDQKINFCSKFAIFFRATVANADIASLEKCLYHMLV